jgi:hypothetical protein
MQHAQRGREDLQETPPVGACVFRGVDLVL